MFQSLMNRILETLETIFVPIAGGVLLIVFGTVAEVWEYFRWHRMPSVNTKIGAYSIVIGVFSLILVLPIEGLFQALLHWKKLLGVIGLGSILYWVVL